jgi:HEAT repeat protein
VTVGFTFDPIKDAVEALKSQNQPSRKWGTDRLLEIGVEAMPALLRAQRKSFSEDQEVQNGLAQLVKRLAPRAIPQLLAALHDKEIAGQAAFAISQLGRSAVSAVPTLVDLAKDGDPRLRSLAILALSKMGPAARPGFEVLQTALGDTDELTRKYAADALIGIGAEGKAAVAKAERSAAQP